MKKIKFSCTHCGAKLRVPTHLAGVSAPCPKCGATITAPSDISEAEVEEPVKQPSPSRRMPSRSPRPEAASSAPAPNITTILEPSAPVLAVAHVQPEPETPVPVPASEAVRQLPPAPAPEPVPLRPPDHLLPSSSTPAPAALSGNSTSGSPAFFVPPAPEPQTVPSEPDPRSDTPADLPDIPDVVVEEEVLFETPPPPPPSQITEPIRVSRTTVDLPPPRPMFRSGSPAPTFGAAAEEAVPQAPAPPTPHRTRVVLPLPGTPSQALSPQDFLAPPLSESSDAAESSHIDLPGEPDPETSETESSLDYGDIENFDRGEIGDFAPLDEISDTNEYAPSYGEEPLSLHEDAGFESSASEGSTEQWGSLEEVTHKVTSEPAAMVAASGEEGDWNLDFSIDELAPEADASSGHSPSDSNPSLDEPFAPGAIRPDDFASEDRPIPSDSLREGSFGRVFAHQSSGSGIQTDLDVTADASDFAEGGLREEPESAPRPNALDELFGDGDETFEGSKRRLSPVMIAMLATLAVVAILAVVGVKVIIDIAGGLEPQEAYREDASEEVSSANDVVIRPKGSVRPTPPIIEAPAIEDPVAQVRPVAPPGETAPPADRPALSFDERVQQAINGGRGASLIGSPGLDPIENRPTDFTAPPQASQAPPATGPDQVLPTLPPNAPEPTALAAATKPASAPTAAPAFPEPSSPEPSALAAATKPASAPAAANNYNPPTSFPVPGKEDDSRLGKTHDLIDAFLRAPDWERRLNYAYQGESLRAAVEDYYRKWPYQPFARYSQRLYQIETDDNGTTYWVFLVSTSDNEDGFPLIVRTENETIKIDWEIFAEFADRHYLRFREGKVAPPATFRLILERFSDYYGSDREAFAELDQYLVFQVNPPYGDFNEFSETVFVKKDSPMAKKIEPILKLGDDPLAVIVTLDRQAFAHGVRHYVITDFVAEGWFR